MTTFIAIWTVGLYFMWLKAHITLRMRGRTDVSGELKAIFELADAMGEGLRDGKQDLRILTEDELRQRIDDELKGGRIFYQSQISVPSFSFRYAFRVWFRKEKWWFLATLIFVAGACTLWSIPGFPFMFPPCTGASYGSIVGLQIGSTWRSRMILILFFACLATLLSIPALMATVSMSCSNC
jgi:hypothetical protein